MTVENYKKIKSKDGVVEYDSSKQNQVWIHYPDKCMGCTGLTMYIGSKLSGFLSIEQANHLLTELQEVLSEINNSR